MESSGNIGWAAEVPRKMADIRHTVIYTVLIHL